MTDPEPLCRDPLRACIDCGGYGFIRVLPFSLRALRALATGAPNDRVLTTTERCTSCRGTGEAFKPSAGATLTGSVSAKQRSSSERPATEGDA